MSEKCEKYTTVTGSDKWGKGTQGDVLFTLNSLGLKSGGHHNLRMLSLVVNSDVGFVELGQVSQTELRPESEHAARGRTR